MCFLRFCILFLYLFWLHATSSSVAFASSENLSSLEVASTTYAAIEEFPEQDTGSLTLTYQTDSRGERLDRIRFVLINEKQECQMYPKGNSVVEEQASHSRQVVIKKLPSGKYLLKFLIPNSDGFFENVPDREIVITRANETKVDQVIAPRYSITRTFPITSNANKTPPEITLRGKDKKISQVEQHPAASHGTFILVVNLKDPLQHLDQLKFKVIDTQGNERQLFLKEDEILENQPHHDYLVLVQELPVGEYQLTDHNSSSILEHFTIHDQKTTILQQSLSQNASDDDVAITRHRKIFAPAPAPLIIYNVNAYITVNSNIPNAHWTLFQDNIRVFSGMGSVLNLQIPAGSNYRVQAEPIEGYTLRVFPPFTFSVNGGDHTTVDITYQRDYGYLNIRTSFADPNGFEIVLRPPEGQPLQFSVRSKEGRISWQSPPLPTGIYELQYNLPETFEAFPPQLVRIERGEHVILRPRFVAAGLLHITANIPEAAFILRTSDNSKAWRGGGREFIFRDLKAGSYILSFTSENPDIFIPPEEIRFSISDYENKEINVIYHFAGSLIIRTNLDRSTVHIKNLGGSGPTLREEITRTKMLSLPEGRYRLTFESPQDSKDSKAPEPVDVDIHPFRTQEINANFTLKETPKAPKKFGQLIVSSNIAEAAFIIHKITDSTKESVGHFSGKSVTVTLDPSQNYEIIFDSVPNYKEPDVIVVNLATGENKSIQATYIPARQTKFVPEGRAIIGDPNADPTNAIPAKTVEISSFSIGVYEVTNAQFALWLNQALKDRKIVYVEEADNRGQVLDLTGRLICKTFEADPYSQISAQIHSTNEPKFIPMPGKDSYPVINVSWYGATIYCQDNKCRLPTEAEWEKAASMAPEKPGEPLKKFRFGFSRDSIDRTWANYKDGTRAVEYFQVLTTPVGFYNGVNLLPLSLESKAQEKTSLAMSPYGAFDMSGNVWEWVSDWYDSSYTKNMSDRDPQGPPSGTNKVVKGGCYDSLEDGVRVFERLALSPEHTDAFTGFRIAVDVF